MPMHNDIDDDDDNVTEHDDVNDNDDNSAQHGGHTVVKRSMQACNQDLQQTNCISFILDTYYVTAIDTCHNKISADHYHMIMSLAQA